MPAALFIRGEDERRARSAWGAAGVAGRSLSYLPDQPVRAAGSSGLEFRRGRLQVVPQSALQWRSLWPASGPLGACGTFGTV